jgi:hypothetical protein
MSPIVAPWDRAISCWSMVLLLWQVQRGEGGWCSFGVGCALSVYAGLLLFALEEVPKSVVYAEYVYVCVVECQGFETLEGTALSYHE